ncbi:MAG TPA: hypothetical protein VMR23_15590 [Candidatus Limnocylindria bacterium]|nr:hypothetical protein [Candidatus Limnocylindria bacterium]
MARVLLRYQTTLATSGGRTYRPRACGRERPDGMWEGWLEFVPDDGTRAVRSGRETSQPNLVDLEYWATGVTPVHLEGALARARAPAFRRPRGGASGLPVSAPVLDPFAAFARGEPHLWVRLRGRRPRYLQQIIRTYDLASDRAALDALTSVELAAFIIGAVRSRLAA